MKNAIIFFLILFWVIFPETPANAAKKFVPKGSASSGTSRSSGGGSGLPVSVRYRPDKRALNFSFSNFNGISSVDYIFSYDSNGITQGAAGSISAASSPGEVRELLFGTCSTSVCTYHTGLKSAKLSITVHYANGRTGVKNYRIKTYF